MRCSFTELKRRCCNSFHSLQKKQKVNSIHCAYSLLGGVAYRCWAGDTVSLWTYQTSQTVFLRPYTNKDTGENHKDGMFLHITYKGVQWGMEKSKATYVNGMIN